MDMEKQLNPVKPSRMISSSPLVLFAIDASTPDMGDSFFEESFSYFVHELSEDLWMGYWKVIRIPDVEIVWPKEGQDVKFQMNEILLEEIRSWAKVQINPEALRIVRIFEFASVKGYAIVICYDDI
jgi:hypothetical protein